MSEHSETPVHPHAGLPCALRSTGMPEANSQSSLHGQASGLPGSHAAPGWKARRTSADHQLSEKVSTQKLCTIK